MYYSVKILSSNKEKIYNIRKTWIKKGKKAFPLISNFCRHSAVRGKPARKICRCYPVFVRFGSGFDFGKRLGHNYVIPDKSRRWRDAIRNPAADKLRISSGGPGYPIQSGIDKKPRNGIRLNFCIKTGAKRI
jgi:hypothetical protein